MPGLFHYHNLVKQFYDERYKNNLFYEIAYSWSRINTTLIRTNNVVESNAATEVDIIVDFGVFTEY